MNQTERPGQLGWIGLGAMGFPMVLRLLAAGHCVTVWGRSRERLVPALEAGAREASSPADVAAASEATFLCVPDGAAVEELIFAPRGIAAGARAGSVLIDHSTIDPADTRRLGEALRSGCAMDWIDAPVSGGPAGASAGTLSTFLGGYESSVNRIRPWIAAYAANVTHMGGPGAGQTTKCCNQLIVTTTIAIWTETLAFAQRCGLEPSVVVDALAGGWADSAIRRALAPGIATRDARVPRLAYFIKDLDFASAAARECGASLPVGEAVASLFRSAAVKAGSGANLNDLTDLF
jgi:3-hydroxyisobutyrate dehydrogenase-like beta-hydroxyacid dehydrogenase